MPDPCCSCKVASVPLNLLPIVRYLDVVFSTSKRQKWRFVVYVLTAQGEQVSETLGKDRVFSVSRRAEDVDSTSPWEADVLPLHHSRENTLRLVKQQCIWLFPALQLNLFDCIVLHSISPRSGHKWSQVVRTRGEFPLLWIFSHATELRFCGSIAPNIQGPYPVR